MAKSSKVRRKPGGSATGLVRDLIHQFDDPLTFYRELIQNAIDAGSNRIDVTLEYKKERPGYVVIHVEDDGQGMDEDAIDNYLLVLFASTKENDFTKIGKFGIGFLSVFAPRPKMVRVFTAKNGQSWHLDFPNSKRYEKYRVPQMREGTLIELIKPLPPREYEKFAQDSRRTIEHWCRYSEAKIFFRDKSSRKPEEQISRSFDLPDGHAVRYAEEGTEVLVGFSAEEKPFYGFYNRGLTLKEGQHAYFPGVCFKVKSRYLEHTLTRDNVLEDDNFRKAMGIVKRIVDDKLPQALKHELEAASAGAEPAALWTARLPFFQRLFDASFAAWTKADWAVFPTMAGAPATLAAVKDGAGRMGKLFFDTAPSYASEALKKQGVQVLRDGPWLELLERWTGKPRAQASSSLICPKILGAVPQDSASFFSALRDLDAQTSKPYVDILAADFGALPPNVEPPFFVAQREPGKPLGLGEREVASFFGPRRFAVLNCAHPSFKTLLDLNRSKPALAAFLALKLIRLHDGNVPPEKAKEYCALADELEHRLLSASIAGSAPRSGGRT